MLLKAEEYIIGDQTCKANPADLSPFPFHSALSVLYLASAVTTQNVK